MKAMYLAAITLACLAPAADAATRYPILNTQGCRCGDACQCAAGECGDDGCSAPAGESPEFMARGPVRRVLAEAKPVRRVLGRLAAVIENRPRVLRRLAGRVFRGGCR